MVDAEIIIGIRGDDSGGRRLRRTLSDVDRAQVRTQKGAKGLEQQFRQTDRAADILKRTVQTLGVAFGLRQLQQVVDTYTNIQNRLKLVTDNSAQLLGVTKELFAISNSTRSAFESTAEVYARTALATKELGLSQRDTLEFTKSLNQAVILSGASSAEASAGLIQLSQGLASGALRGDELRSVLEQLPAVADVIAKGLGVTRGELRKMGEEGKITADIVIDSFKKAREELNDKFAKTVPTISQSFTVLKNNVIELTGELDKASGASSKVSQLILLLANNVDVLAIAVGVAATAWIAYRSAALLATGATVLAGIIGTTTRIGLMGETIIVAKNSTLLLNAAFLTGPGALVVAFATVTGLIVGFRKELSATVLFISGTALNTIDSLKTGIRQLGFAIEGATGQRTRENARQLIAAEEGFLNLRKGKRDSIVESGIAGLLEGPDGGTVSTARGNRTAPTGINEGVKDAQKEIDKLIKSTRSEQETLNNRVRELGELRAFANTAEEIQAIDRALEVANEQLKTASNVIPGLADDTKDLSKTMDRFADTAADAFTSFITGATDARSALSSLVDSLLKLTFEQTVTNPLSGLLSGVLTSGFGGLFGGGMSAGASAAAARGAANPALFGPGFVTGGSMILGGAGGVDQNQLSLNGSPIARVSRGETLSVNPAGGGQPVVVNQTFNLSMGVKETVAAELAAVIPQIQESTRMAVNEANARGIR